MQLAPIILFVYNRPDHTKRTVESLLKNDFAQQSDLIIYSDAAKNNNSEKAVADVRDYIKSIKGFRSLRVIEHDKNMGLADSIISGVTESVGRYGKVIVLEDDMVSSPYFIKYMNNALVKYENEDKVISIHGYIYPVKKELPETFFIRGADCWGWATWKRGWDLFEADGKKLLQQLVDKKLEREFNFNGSYPYLDMLKGQIERKNNSWAIRWYASAFLKDKLTLYPGKSLIHNIGNDESGTHSMSTESFAVQLSDVPLNLTDEPIIENKKAKKILIQYFQSLKRNKIQLILSKVLRYFFRQKNK